MSLQDHLKELEIYRAANNQEGIANLTFKIGDIYLKKGKWDEATAYMSEAEAICRKLGNDEGRAVAAIGLGDVFRASGNPAEACAHYRQALEFFEEEGRHEAIANLAERLGEVYRQSGDQAEALEAFRKGLAICRAHHDQLGIAHFSERLGLVYRSLNDLDAAMACFQEALTFFEQNRVADRLAFLLAGIGDVRQKAGRSEEALDYLGRARGLYRRLGARPQADLIAAQITAIEEMLGEEKKREEPR
jgi:tetratricopeptide (TPR) repeat protein